MPEYIYTARTVEGKLKKDRTRAKNERALADYLRNKGLILTSAKELKKGGKFSLKNILNSLSRVSSVNKIFFTQNLSVMVKTGFSLGMALDTLAKQAANKKLKRVIEEVKRDVESGISFSNSLAKHPKIFSELFVNMVAAGEASGKLDDVLRYLTTQMRKDHALMAKVKSAMMYPSLVVFAMVSIGIVMMVTIIPQLSAIYQDSDLELPLPTRMLIALSNLLVHQGIWVILVLIILVILFLRIKKTKKGKYYLHLVLLKLPILSKILKKINLARFTRTLSSLLKTDIPIVQTFQIISKTLGNVHYKQAMLETSEMVKKGVSIVKTLEKKPHLFPPIVTQMIAVGEESGMLDDISEEIASFFEEDVSQTMEGLTAIIEPLLMLVIGSAVAVAALAVLMPMYGLVEAIE